MLLETIVRSFAPVSRSAWIRRVGFPERPKPPTAMVIPSSTTEASASSASSWYFNCTLFSPSVHDVVITESDNEPTGALVNEQEFSRLWMAIVQKVTRGTECVHNVDMVKKGSGVQVLSRAAALLRVVSGAMPDGVTTSDAARQTNMARPTAHRILDSLATEGFCDQDAKTGRWLLGPELFLLGNIAGARYDVTETAQKHVHALAQQTEESAFFSTLRGNETVCLVREDGAFPIRSFVLYEGRRFPLGVASAG